MTTFIAYGSDILENANISTNSSAGQDGAGQVTVTGGTSVFPDGYLVEFEVQNVLPSGEFDGSTGFIGITVYASEADYLAGIPTYTYTPQNPGQSAGIQNSVDGIGDTYVRINANVLVSSDSGAPSLGSMFISPGSDIANQSSTTIDHHTDVDYNGNQTIDAGTIEDGNGFFNIANSSTVCFESNTYILTPNGQTPILDLSVGDLVDTADNGPQRILWIGKRHITRLQLLAQPKLRPVFVPAGVLGATQDTLFSRQHAIAQPDGSLMRSNKLLDRPKSRMRIAKGRKSVTYLHLMFENHEVIFANGIPAESFYPGTHALRALTKSQLSSLHTLVPSLIDSIVTPQSPHLIYGPTARPLTP